VGPRPPGAAPPLVVVVGPTASGKSGLGVALARALGGEVINADAMALYRGMDVGTAKPTQAEQAEVRHHLIDVVDPDDDYTVSRFQRDCLAALADIEARGRRALLVGGTGLYLRAVTDQLEIPGQFPDLRNELESDPDTEALFRHLEQLDPVAAGRMEPSNRRRVVRALEVTMGSGRPFSSFGPGLDAYPPTPFPVVALRVPRPDLDARIARRYDQQMADGFLDEVRALLTRPAGLSRTARQALGYAELLDHLEHGTPLDDALAAAVRRTKRFARRQERWFQRDPRIEWVPAGPPVTSGRPTAPADADGADNPLAHVEAVLES
jgi:tRNA dimethylallyltransferase